MEKVAKKRNGFASGIGFILAAAGSAIGLGNLWSFPYKTSVNGGAAFVFVYIISVILLGSVVMIAEMYIGKRAQANPVTSYKKTNKALGWLGLFAVIIPFIITCYYSVLGGFTVKYALNSFSENANILGSFSGNVGEVILYTAIFMVLALIVVMGGVQGGIEKASKVLMPTLFLILVALVIYCLTLGEGVKDGIDFYLNPNFKELGFKGVLAAMGQAFYSMSLGMGIMVSYGSYAGKEMKLGKSALMICAFDTIVALLAGLAIFPAIYHYQAISGADDMTIKGVVLMFQTLPLVFDNLGTLGQIVSFLFFGMVTIAALTSVISLLEVITQFVIQKFRVHRKKAILTVAAITFAVSVPIGISLGFAINDRHQMLIFGYNWLDFFDLVANTVLMPVCALGSCIAVGWFIGKYEKKRDLFNPVALNKALKEDGLELGRFGNVFAVMIKYGSPLIILLIEIFGVKDLMFPNGKFDVNGLGIVLTALGIIAVAIAVYFIFFNKIDCGCNQDEFEIIEKEKREEKKPAE